jgi:hypothetical protein
MVFDPDVAGADRLVPGCAGAGHHPRKNLTERLPKLPTIDLRVQQDAHMAEHLEVHASTGATCYTDAEGNYLIQNDDQHPNRST